MVNTMLRCLNCVLNMKYNKRHAVKELSLQLQNLLRDWLALDQLPVDAVLCHACLLIVKESASDDQGRRLGHTNVCIGCGCSVLNARNHVLEADSPLLNIFQWNINLPGHRNQVCQSCWMTGNRRIEQDKQRVNPVHSVYIQLPPGQHTSPAEEAVQLEAPTTDPSPSTEPVAMQREISINLPNYKRAANTARHCIYSTCRNAAGHLVPTFIKAMMIKEYNFYIPRHARVCDMHLNSNTWQSLPEISNTIAEFTATQIEDTINLAKKEISFDFENVHEMPNHICQYWTGLNVPEFLALLKELPLLDNYVTSPKSSLAMYLIKLRTGDSNKRLSSLFQIARSTLESRMKKVKEYLDKHGTPTQIVLQDNSTGHSEQKSDHTKTNSQHE